MTRGAWTAAAVALDALNGNASHSEAATTRQSEGNARPLARRNFMTKTTTAILALCALVLAASWATAAPRNPRSFGQHQNRPNTSHHPRR